MKMIRLKDKVINRDNIVYAEIISIENPKIFILKIVLNIKVVAGASIGAIGYENESICIHYESIDTAKKAISTISGDI